MVFDPVSEEQRKQFIRESYAAHLPGYTGHCPTLKFCVGKRFGACTQEIMKELLQKKILKTGPYRANFENDTRECENAATVYENNTNAREEETRLFRTPPYILGYTGYIPGFNNRHGLSFMRAVEEGAREWCENQMKLKARRDVTYSKIDENASSRQFLLRARANDADMRVSVNYDRNCNNKNRTFHYEISPERPPIVGYTGHIPGVKGEVALSKRYAQAAKKGLELVRKEREERFDKLKGTNTVEKVLNATHFNGTSLVKT